jgi:acyl carrier protein
MEDAKKLALLEEAFEMEEGVLAADMVLEDIEEYNSMAKLALIVLMSDEFNKKLTSDQIKAFKTVQDIMDFMA